MTAELSQNELINIYNAHFVTQDNYQYIVFDKTPDQSLSNYYYFHNINSTTSCLDCMYTVVDDNTVFNLVNYTNTITTTSNITFLLGQSAINKYQKLWFSYAKSVTLTGTLNQYYTSFAKATNSKDNDKTVKLIMQDDIYYINPNYLFVYINNGNNEYIPIQDDYIQDHMYHIRNTATPTSIASAINTGTIVNNRYFNNMYPCKLMKQFKKTYPINIPKGIYTYSEFKELLATVEWPTGYVFDPSTATLSTSCAPEYTFAIDTNVFDIPQKFVRSLCFTDLLPKQSKVFVINNQYVYTPLQSNCSVIMKNSVPTCIDNVDSVIPFCMNSNNNYIECQQEFEQSAPVLQLANNVLNRIIDNSNYTYIQLTGTLLSTNIIGSNNDVTIGDTTFHVTVPQRINRKFKLPLTISGGSDVMFMCRVKFLN